jgi:hypothetical protein
MESYDGGEVPDLDPGIDRAWRDGLKPDPLLTVSEWADRYRVLSQRASSEPAGASERHICVRSWTVFCRRRPCSASR